MADIIISGYHGYANSGDEALLFAILNNLREKQSNLDVTVLSKTPRETARIYGVNSIFRYNIFKIIKEMKKSKMLLFGGGSLIQDVTSRKSILYYLTIIRLAQRCKMKTMLYANGIGPVIKKADRFLCRKILDRVNVITLRDDKSDVELKKLGVTSPKIVITADPAFTLDFDGSLSGNYFTKIAGVPSGTKLFIVSVRDWMGAKDNFDTELAKLCDYMAEKYELYPLFVPMQYPDDLSLSQRVIQKMKFPSYIINRELSVPEMLSVLYEAELVIGMRLHSLIYATTLEIPAMALVYDPKVSAFMDSINQTDWINIESFSCEDSIDLIDKIVADKISKKQLLHERNAILKKMALENANYALKLLNS